MSKQRAVEAYKNHLLETDVKRAEQLRQIAENEASLGDFDIEDVKREAKQLVENEPRQNNANPTQSKSPFVRRNPNQPTPNQIKQAKKTAKNRKKMRGFLGLKNKPTQNTGGRPTFVSRKPQPTQQPQQPQSTQQPQPTQQPPKKPRTMSDAQMRANIEARKKRKNFANKLIDSSLRNMSQSNISGMQGVNNPTVAKPQKSKKIKVKRNTPTSRVNYPNKPSSKSSKLSDFRNMNNKLSDINNVTLDSIKNIKDPRLRRNVANNLISQLENLDINKADFDESEKLILKMKVNSIIKKLEE